MKKIKLGFLTLLAICVGSVAFVRCSSDTEGDVKITHETAINQKSSNEVYIQDIKLILEDQTEVKGQLTFTIDSETEELVDLKFSDELLDPSTGIDPIKFVQELQTVTYGEHKKCIDSCKKEFIDPSTGQVKTDPTTGEPISGFGACKFNCWVDTTVRALESLAKIADVVKGF